MMSMTPPSDSGSHESKDQGASSGDESGAPGGRGLHALDAQEFSLAQSVGGVRGLGEAVAPGLVFVLVYVTTRDLSWSLIGSIAVALGAVAVRLAQRTPVTSALGGLFGVVVGVVWAWASGEGRNYFSWGLVTNAVYGAVILVSIVVRWPAIGVIVEAMRAGFGSVHRGHEAHGANGDDPAEDRKASYVVGAHPGWTQWRADPAVVRRYTVASWLWVGLFAVRLAVQVPLYSMSEVAWLGAARLVMGVPLWALVLWRTWVLVRVRPSGEPSSQRGAASLPDR